MAAEFVGRQVAQVAAVDGDPAFFGEVEALQQLGQGALAGAGRPHEGHAATGSKLQAQVAVEPGLFLSIAEGDAFDFDAAGSGLAALGDEGEGFGRRVHDVAQPFDGNAGLLEFHVHGRNATGNGVWRQSDESDAC
jgi:hypothetical protein